MTPREANEAILTPALAMLPRQMDTPQARIIVLAIALQESRLVFRRQLGDGPARSLWQMERGGGVRGVIRHPASRYWMADICHRRDVECEMTALWSAIEHDDILACCAARLLLFTDPYKLPSVSDPDAGWRLYERVWRPGKPRPEDWPDNHHAALYEVIK